MREPLVAGAAARGEQSLFLVALEAPVPRPSLGWPAYERAGIGREVHVPFAPGRLDRVGEDVEFAIYGRAGDDLQPLIAIGGQEGARERRHPDARKLALRHRPEPKVLIGGAALGRRHFAPVALEDLRKGGPLGGPPIDVDPLVDVRLDAARPLLGERLLSKVCVCAGKPARRTFTRQNLPRLSKVAIGQFSWMASHPARHRHCPRTVPKCLKSDHSENNSDPGNFLDPCSADVSEWWAVLGSNQ